MKALQVISEMPCANGSAQASCLLHGWVDASVSPTCFEGLSSAQRSLLADPIMF